MAAPPAPNPVDWQADFRGYLNVLSTVALVWMIIFGLLALISLVIFVIGVIFYFSPVGLFSFLYCGITAFLSLLVHERCKVWGAWANQGSYPAIREPALLWGILTLIFGLVVGILLLILYLRLERFGAGFFWGPPAPPASPPPSAPYSTAPPSAPPLPGSTTNEPPRGPSQL